MTSCSPRFHEQMEREEAQLKKLSSAGVGSKPREPRKLGEGDIDVYFEETMKEMEKVTVASCKHSKSPESPEITSFPGA